MEMWSLSTLSPEPHRPEVLCSDHGAVRTIALLLPAGEELQEHQVHEHAWVLVGRGTVTVTAGDDEREAIAGSLIHFPPAERHRVQAREESLLVLLLAPWPGEGHPGSPG